MLELTSKGTLYSRVLTPLPAVLVEMIYGVIVLILSPLLSPLDPLFLCKLDEILLIIVLRVHVQLLHIGVSSVLPAFLFQVMNSNYN